MANGVELGKAYISIIATANQIAPEVKKQFRVIDDDAGKLGLKIGSQISGKLKTALKVGAGAVAGLGALVGGLAIKGGIERALKIDTAQKKLKGLGHDADSVQAIMKNALASVKGTSFGLGEAATTAAGAVAAGIKPGERLEQVLKSVANSAAAAQVDMGEMGGIFNKVASLGKAQNDVLQQVADKGLPIYQALGKQMGLTAEEVFQAASKGKISFEQFEAAMRDASGTVAQEMGNTLPGKFANFKASLSRLGESVVAQVLPHIGSGFAWLTEKADALGPAAKRAGEALGKAVGEAGKWMTGTLIPAVKDAATWLQDRTAPAVEAITGWLRDHLVPALRDTGSWIKDTLVPALQDSVTWIKENSTWLGPLTAAVIGGAVAWSGYAFALKAADLAAGGFNKIGPAVIGVVKGLNAALRANPIGLVVTAIGALVAGLVWFFTQTEEGQKLWGQIWGGIKFAVDSVVDWFVNVAAPAFQGVWDAIVFAADSVRDWFVNVLAPALSGIWDTILFAADSVADWWTNVLAPALSGVWDTIQQAAEPVIGWFSTHVGPVFEALGELMRAVWGRIIVPLFDLFVDGLKIVGQFLSATWNNALKPTIDALGKAFAWLWDNAIKPAIDAIQVGWQIISDAISVAWEHVIKPAVDAIGKGVMWLWDVAVQPAVNAIQAGWTALWDIVKATWDAVGSVIMAAIGTAWQVAVSVVAGAMQAIWSVISTVWNIIKNTIETVLAVIAGIIRTVTAAINGDWGAVWNNIVGVFNSIVGGLASNARFLFDGILGYFKGVWTAISGTWSAVWDGIQKVGKAAWDWISRAIGAIFEAIKKTVTGIWDGMSRAWGGFWDGLKSTGKAAWDWISSTVGGVWESIATAAGEAWDGIVTTIGGAWDKIKSTVASPINAVIGFINKGIIGSYNWVADKIKIIPRIEGTIPEVKFARGGILPGKSSWRNGDDQLAWMRRGEGVTVSEALRDPYERTRLLALNKAAMSGMSPARFRARFDSTHPAGCGCGLAHHATGGIIGFRGHRFTSTFAARILQAEKIAGARMHISQGGFRPRTSYSGTSHAGDALDITGDFRRFIAPLRQVGIAAWDRTGKGRWVPHVHGVPLPGHGTPLGSAIWQAQDYLRGGDGLGGRDNGPGVAIASADIEEAVKRGADKAWWEKLADAVGDAWDKIKGWFSDMAEKIAGPLKSLQGLVTGDGPFDNLVSKIAEKLGKDLKNWVAKKLGLPVEEGYATGTRHARPGWAWVGERGPELVHFRGGEQVYTHAESKQMAGGMVVNLSMPHDAFRSVEDLIEFLRDLPRAVRQMEGASI
ncbi:hypothetical protein EII34_15110 [Arachnia propionica]|uniref:Tape measure protein N-terminal domain-containing protein n=1 Tax=Arachnia propionica TaxID=1750 RepID=A0A3P1T133_9ACTN|nr:tape measure protein [Arachnia propionica]RRD03232.1 hypothetical protein EII34_15110 [Arachnia propionica]